MNFINSGILWIITILLIPFVISLPVQGKDISEHLQFLENIQNKSQALTMIEQLQLQSDISNKEKILILGSKAKIYHKLGQLNNALLTATEERKLAEKYNFQNMIADSNRHIGAFAFFKGESALALESYLLSLKYYETVDEPIFQADLYNNIAIVYDQMGKLNKALYYFNKAEILYQKFGNTQDHILIRYNIANLYFELKRYHIAIGMFNETIEQRRKLSDEEGIAHTNASLGLSYQGINEYQKAAEYLEKAEKYFLNINDEYNLSFIYENFSDLYNQTHESTKAIIYGKKAQAISFKQNNNFIQAASLKNLAVANFDQKKYKKALSLTKKAMAMAVKSKDQSQINDNFALQSLIYASLNQSSKALDQQKKFVKAYTELLNVEINSALSAFESKNLKRQVTQLKQQKRLQELEIERKNNEKNFIITVVAILLLIILFIIYLTMVRRSTNVLESKVKQRTNELEVLMEDLKAANNVKSQFLANISHEIRTPLTTLIAQSEAMIKGDVHDSYITDEVSIIHSNSLHLLELTNNILDLNKIEANKIELELNSYNLHGILQQLANIFTLQASSKGINFEITHRLPDPFIVLIDVFRVKQVLINLCANAIKFTHNGQVKLNLSYQDEQLIFTISDSGIGMSQSQLQSVFESFTQGDSSISRRFGGTGLGLCLSDQLAKIMGGKIEVESELNKGSQFSFSLPCPNYTSTDEIDHKVDITSTQIQKPSIESKHLLGNILLVEDHEVNRKLIARLLESLGLCVITACNGKEAIELVKAHQPDVILMDIQMPEMDGIEAFHILRQQNCDIPIIALTANAMSHEVEHYLSMGFNDYLAKPIDRNIFIPMIITYFDDRNEHKSNIDNVDLSDLVIQFKSNLVLEQEDLILHINNNNIDEMVKLVHRIAGAAQMFGFPSLSTAAIKVEIAVKKENLDKVNELTQVLLNEIDQVLW